MQMITRYGCIEMNLKITQFIRDEFFYKATRRNKSNINVYRNIQ